MSDTTIKASEGNVFADMGVKNAGQALRKAELARQIGDFIEARGLTPAQAAKKFRIDQAQVSALRGGVLNDFSVECLRQFLNVCQR